MLTVQQYEGDFCSLSHCHYHCRPAGGVLTDRWQQEGRTTHEHKVKQLLNLNGLLVTKLDY